MQHAGQHRGGRQVCVGVGAGDAVLDACVAGSLCGTRMATVRLLKPQRSLSGTNALSTNRR
jgi:hypothetical protein